MRGQIETEEDREALREAHQELLELKKEFEHLSAARSALNEIDGALYHVRCLSNIQDSIERHLEYVEEAAVSETIYRADELEGET